MKRWNYIRVFLIGALLVSLLILSSYSAMAYDKEINSISKSIAEKIATAGKKKVTVIDFTDLQGNVTELGRFLAEEFSLALVEAGKGYEVVDRNNLKVIIKEQEPSSRGPTGSQLTTPQIYREAGIDALITGTITPFSDSIRITIKILDITTAKIIGAARGNIARTKDLEELLGRGVKSAQSRAQQLSARDDIPQTMSMKERVLRAVGLQSLTTKIIRPICGLKSKRVGDLDIIIRKITVLPEGRVNVELGFFNNSYQRFLGARYKPAPSLTDEKGHVFKYEGGLKTVYSANWSQGWRNGLDLPNQANKRAILSFVSGNKDISPEEIGSNFTFSLDYLLYNPKNRKTTSHSVSFADIMAQK